MTVEPAAPMAEAPPAPKPKRPKNVFDPTTMRLVNGVPNPPVVLWETVLLVSQVVTLLAVISVGVLSVMAGVMWWMVAVRVGLTLAALSAVLWLINWQVAHGTLEAAQKEAREHLANQARALAENPPSTVELEA